MKLRLFILIAAGMLGFLHMEARELQHAADSMQIFYRRGYRYVDLSFRDNRTQLERFLKSTGKAMKDGSIDKIVIRSYASPDGSSKANERLAAGRAEELKAYLVREGDIPPALIEHHAEGIAWDRLREMVAASDMQHKEEVLEILDNTPVWVHDSEGNITGSRKQQLMDLNGGRTYNYMLENFFPDLRNSSNAALYLRIMAKRPETEAYPAPPDTSLTPEPQQVQTKEAPTENVPEPSPEQAIESPAPAAQTDCLQPEPTEEKRIYPKNIIGIHAGYGISWIVSYGMKSSVRHGFEIGVTDRIRLMKNAPLYLRTGLDFISKGYDIRGFDDSRTTMYYLSIPVAVDYTVISWKNFTLTPFAGLHYAVGVGGERESGNGKVAIFRRDGGFSRHDFGFICGAEATFGRFMIGAEWQLGLTDIARTDTMYGNDSHMIGYKNVRNRCFIIKAGINF